ncbi:MAG: uroporphyrinogen-III synthase [Eubacteriales bacterium]
MTGPLHSNGQLEYKLRNLGADVHVLPMIEVVPLDVKEELIAEINHMSDMAYLVFTSKNGVNLFFEQLAIMKKDARIMWNTKVVAIGPSTSEALKNNGIVADFMPYNYNTQSLINEWIPQVQIDEKVLILRAEKATNEFTEHLQEKGLYYKEIKMYRTIFKPQQEVEKLTKEHILVCFTSASTVESFMQNKPDTSCVLGVCIGQKTGEAARRYGLQYVVSKQASIESMVEKMKEIVAC